MRVTYTVTVDFTERDECASLMAIRIGSDAGDIGACDSDACRYEIDLRNWLGSAIIGDARENWRIEQHQNSADSEQLADEQSQAYADAHEANPTGGRYF